MQCGRCGGRVARALLIGSEPESDEEASGGWDEADGADGGPAALCARCLARARRGQEAELRRARQSVQRIEGQIEALRAQIAGFRPNPDPAPLAAELARLEARCAAAPAEEAAEPEPDDAADAPQPARPEFARSDQLVDYQYRYFAGNNALQVLFPINRRETCICGLRLAHTPLLDEVNAACLQLTTLLAFLNSYYQLGARFRATLPAPYFEIRSAYLRQNPRGRRDGAAEFVALEYRRRNLIEKIATKHRVSQHKLNAAIMTRVVGLLLRVAVQQRGDAMLGALVRVPAWALDIAGPAEYEREAVRYGRLGVEVVGRFSCEFEPADYCCFMASGAEHGALHRDLGEEDGERFAGFADQLFGLLEAVYAGFE